MDWPKDPTDHGPIYLQSTLLDLKYKNSSHAMKMYTISDLQFRFTHLGF